MSPYVLYLWYSSLLASVCCSAAWQVWTSPLVDPTGRRVEGMGEQAITSVWPGPRDGHTLALYRQGLVLVFGGRANERIVPHVPKTFEVKKVNGTLQFITYDQQVVYPCENKTQEECYNIEVGRFYNDLWAYSLDCPRGWDTQCAMPANLPAFGSSKTGWAQLEAGSQFGGCVIVKGKEICTHPHERFGHQAAVFDDGALIIYGGFSRLCEDYCSDMWTINITACISTSGQAQKAVCKWRKLAELGRNLPGKRWRAGSAQNSGKWIIYGGYRLWHGFAQSNSVANNWLNYEKFERGGYLDDMWIFEYNGTQTLDHAAASASGGWQQIMPRETCFSSPPSLDYETRQNIVCTVMWPKARAAPALTLKENRLWMHGGYTTPFPHPHFLGRGAGVGTSFIESDSITSYPSITYYLDDLWQYDLDKGYWTQLKPKSLARPVPRFGHNMVIAGHVLIMTGGAYHGNFLHETWLYDLSRQRWHEKRTHVHPLFPASCISDVSMVGDVETIRNMSVYGEPTRVSILDGKDGRATAPVLVQQPRRRSPGWDGCRSRVDNRTDLPQELQWLQPSQRAWHGGVYSERHQVLLVYGGETAQYEAAFQTNYTVPSHTVGDFWAFNLSHCTQNCSNRGTCYLGTCICDPGWYGIDCSNVSCPGDLCKFDYDSMETTCVHCVALPYVHRMKDLITNPEVNKADAFRLIFAQEMSSGGKYAPDALPQDVYQFFARKALANWTSLALSDARTRWLLDKYEGGIAINWNASLEAARRITHGVCDGFGQCQCAPPFLGDDCSILDCPNSCSGHGWCSVEYPVSRCMCTPPWAGPDCRVTACPNNCSFPNGVCDANGICRCAWMTNPYNKSQNLAKYAGDDCSYLMPFAGGERNELSAFGLAIALAVMYLTSRLTA